MNNKIVSISVSIQKQTYKKVILNFLHKIHRFVFFKSKLQLYVELKLLEDYQTKKKLSTQIHVSQLIQLVL